MRTLRYVCGLGLALTSGCFPIGLINEPGTLDSDSNTLIFVESKSAIDGTWNGTASASENVFSIYSDGTGWTNLTQHNLAGVNTLSVEASPTSDKITYSSTADIGGALSSSAELSANIWILNSDGTGRTPLTQNTIAGLGSTDPNFSPDGYTVTFASLMDNTGNWDGTPEGSTNIWKINTDGTGLTMLTCNTAALLNSATPAFSPAGTKIAFRSTQDITGACNGTAVNAQNIWVMDIDGGNPVPITLNTSNVGGTRNSTFPSFSPDSQKLVYRSLTALDGTWDGVATSSYNIWIANADGTGRTALTQNTAAGYNSDGPTFSPSGNKIVFASKTALNGTWNGAATGSSNIWIVNTDGTGLTALTSNSAASLDSIKPQFTPDGTKIVFNSLMPIQGVASTSYNVWIMSSDGSGAMPLTQNTGASRDSFSHIFNMFQL